MPPFHNYATFYGKFWVKNIFSRMQLLRKEKSVLRSVPLISNCIFFEKKNSFFLQNFRDFWVFLKFRSIVAKSETCKWFFRIFRTFWHLYWPLVCVRIEMGNLLAKTPYVTRYIERNEWLFYNFFALIESAIWHFLKYPI